MSNIRRFRFLLLTLLFPIQSHAQDCSEHGIPISGLPNWQERTMLVFTNAARIAPIPYRDTMMPGAGNILMPDRYPAVPPLQYNYNLNRSSRAHSEEMATASWCGLQHNSCDGTTWATRIGSYYPNWALLGENVAGGFTSPSTVIGGLLADPYAGAPAPDGSGYDGHRWNIMYGNYTEIGTGYASGSNQYIRYYTQDFARPLTLNQPCSPIAAGSHELNLFSSNTTNFVVNYYDPNNRPPQSANVVINGISYPLSVFLGSAARGTYKFDITQANSCRSYHFEFVDAAGAFHRFPSRGWLKTFREGSSSSCSENFLPQNCRTDFNSSGTLSELDIFDFLDSWFRGVLKADFNRSGALEVQDIFDFVNSWVQGCP